MTVSNTTNHAQYAGDGSTTVFPTGFKFLANEDVKAILTDAAGNDTVWVLGTDYSLTGAGVEGGGTLTANVAPADQTHLTILPAADYKQPDSLPLEGRLPSTTVEGMDDRSVLQNMQQGEQLERALKFAESSKVRNIDFPQPLPLTYIRWNQAGDGLESADITTWLNGSGAPDPNQGSVGDYYIDNDTGDYYRKTGEATWTLLGNLKGPAGEKGDTGDGMAPQGPWGAGATYAVNDGVTYLGSYWRSLQAGNTGNPPDSSPAFWELTVQKGDQGAPGADGQDGAPGADGQDGADGSRMYFGDGAPAGGLGVVGDYYKDGLTSDYYEKTGASAWTLRGNDKGLKGDKGDQGDQGVPGNDGADGQGVVAGGTTGQALTKASNADYDTEWTTISTGGIGAVVEDPSPQLGGDLDCNGNDILLSDGLLSNLPLRFGSDADLGFYRVGANELGIVAGSGAAQIKVGVSSVDFRQKVRVEAGGTQSAPAITYTLDTNTGIFWAGNDAMGLSAGGQQALRVSESGNNPKTTVYTELEAQGTIASTGTVNGRDMPADGAKLDGIAPGANNYSHPNHTGDVTSVGDGAQTIANDAVNNAKLANVPSQTFKGRDTAGTGDPEDMSKARALGVLNTLQNVALTQAEYDALSPPDADTLYFITG